MLRISFDFVVAWNISENNTIKGERDMSKKEKLLLKAAIAFALMFAVTPAVNAMHIMEGYLPAKYCIAWGAVCAPFLVAGFLSLKKKLGENRKNITLIAMAGAFIFVISSLKIPSVTGSCSHMTGTGLGAILFGPAAVSILGIIVLLFQAVLLAHGGLTTIGANTFSMAIAGPLLSFGIYKLCGKLKVNRKVSVFLAAFLGDLFTYCVTSIQLAMAYPSEAGGVGASAVKFLGVFAPTQLPLAVIEGILTVVIVMAMESYAKPELKAIGFFEGGQVR
jgi:cobalt/nickel transport system permease protein